MTTTVLDLLPYIYIDDSQFLYRELETRLADNQSANLFVYYVFDPEHHVDSLPRLLTIIDKLITTQQWHILLDFQSQPMMTNIQYTNNPHIVYIHYWPLTVKLLTSKTNDRWNSAATDVLMLTGKIGRLNRIGTLASAFKHNLIHRIKFSFLTTDKVFPLLEKLIQPWGLNFHEFIEYCNKHKIIDKDQRYLIMDDGSVYLLSSLFNIDPSLYANTKFSIVTPTSMNGTAFTKTDEKVWKAIANSHPFAYIGLPWNKDEHSFIDNNDFLESIGIKTLREYLPPMQEITPAYIDLSLERIFDIVNDQSLNNCLQDMVTHNKKRYEEICNEYLLVLTKLWEDLELQHHFDIKTFIEDAWSDVSLDRVATVKSSYELHKKTMDWDELYASLRGSDWPECDITNIDRLPQFIKDELARFDVDLTKFST